MPTEKWSGPVSQVRIGATAEEGGTRSHVVTVGGAQTLSFLAYEGVVGARPVIAFEVLDRPRETWAEALEKVYGDVKPDPAAWVQNCLEEFGAELNCLRFAGASPDDLYRSPSECAEIAKQGAETVSVPLIIWGGGNAEKDNNLWPELSPALAGERVVLASATQDNYRTIAACCLADKHICLTEAPLDINIQKQVNILVSETGVKPDIIQYQSRGRWATGSNMPIRFTSGHGWPRSTGMRCCAFRCCR